MNALPRTITKTEEPQYDEYTGPLEDLIAAGLVRRDQLPPAGKNAVSWSHGVQRSKNVRRDEHYLRVVLKPRGRAVVWVGVSAEIAAPRQAAARAAWAKRHEEREAKWKREAAAAADLKSRKQDADMARHTLAFVMKYDSGEVFRKETALCFRQSVERHFVHHNRDGKYWHGYTMTEESIEAIAMAMDAVIEAVRQADVVLDAEHRAQFIAKQRAIIRAADPGFERQFDRLTTPNPSIIAGEQA